MIIYPNPRTSKHVLTENVFQATSENINTLGESYTADLLENCWYYAEINWTTFIGPFLTQEQTDKDFKAYVMKVRMCPSCEE